MMWLSFVLIYCLLLPVEGKFYSIFILQTKHVDLFQKPAKLGNIYLSEQGDLVIFIKPSGKNNDGKTAHVSGLRWKTGFEKKCFFWSCIKFGA